MRVNRPTLFRTTRIARGLAKTDGTCTGRHCYAEQIAQSSSNPIKNLLYFLQTRKICKEKYGALFAR